MSDYSVFTSESVSEGHPDKMADHISDAILDALITDDKYTRAGIETAEAFDAPDGSAVVEPTGPVAAATSAAAADPHSRAGSDRGR
mgnify:CR=1 FL=1